LADRQDTSAFYKKEIKLPASIGDWTAYKPAVPSAKIIKPLVYGFHRISREELETTLTIHHFFALEASKFLKDALKASTDVLSVSIEQITYLDFLKRVTGGLIYCKLPLKNIGEALFMVDYQLANLIINFSLGSQTVDTKIKELTELEESIIQSVFGSVLGKYADCWRSVFDKPVLEIISYPNIQRETNINLNEIITVVSTQVSLANSAPTTFTFVYQNLTLKKLNDLLSEKEDKTPLNFSSLSNEILSSIEIPIIAQLGVTKIAAGELTEIETEDVISLDQKLNDPIKLFCGYASEFKAQPGIENSRMAVRILGGSVKKIKRTPVAKIEKEGTSENAGERLTAQEEDVELPLEVEEKEEYNESPENLFEEENENPQA